MAPQAHSSGFFRLAHAPHAMLLLAMALLLFWVPEAHAQGGALNGVAENFACQGGQAQGNLFAIGGNCPALPGVDHLFSFYVCEFEKIVDQTFKQMYCGILAESAFPVTAALTLFIVLMGTFFTMGVLPFTAKDLMMTLFKFTFVLTFALNSDYVIGVAYKFFMLFSKEGIAVVLSHLGPDGGFQNGDDVYRKFDQMIFGFLSLFAAGEADAGQCKNAIFAAMAIIAAAFPPLFMLSVYMLVKLLWVLFRTVCGYCLGILGIAFLLTMAPLFVPFALFRFTRPLFDKYLQYLGSFAFQMVVVFAFIGMILSMGGDFKAQFLPVMDLVKPYKKDLTSNAFVLPWQFCGVCDVQMQGDKPTCKSEDAQEPGALAKDNEFLKFATRKVILLLVMAYLIDIMMDIVPEMARYLAGPRVMLRLGGGKQGVGGGTSVSLPGEQALEQGMQKLAQSDAGAFKSQAEGMAKRR